jgi:hypothetical protein
VRVLRFACVRVLRPSLWMRAGDCTRMKPDLNSKAQSIRQKHKASTPTPATHCRGDKAKGGRERAREGVESERGEGAEEGGRRREKEGERERGREGGRGRRRAPFRA